MDMKTPIVFVITGVSGSGKTTIGRALADKTGCPFYDGDDFHPPDNLAKMANGIPLEDADRLPWLRRLHDLIHEHLERGETAVFTCSALKKRYRDLLRCGNQGVILVFLGGEFDLVQGRIRNRQGHFMKARMLGSQFEALEIPSADEAILIDTVGSVEEITSLIQERVKDLSEGL